MTPEVLKRRDIYLNQLLSFQDTEPVKVVTGIRRCGKSSLLKLMQAHLLSSGVSPEQIIEINFEAFAFVSMDAAALYQYVKDRILPDKRMYLFLDEIQRVKGWENAVNAFRVEFSVDIYITSSNACLLSSELATYLSGRCVEIPMYPLSFREFLDFLDFQVQTGLDAFGTKQTLLIGPDGNPAPLSNAFSAYLRFGGMPGVTEVGLVQNRALMLLEGICNTVMVLDIMDREQRRGRQQISDASLLRKIILFLADNIGSTVSLRSIGNTLSTEGMQESRKGNALNTHTVQAYVSALQESYLFYEIKRFDIKGKGYLQTLGKYYIADIGLRNALLGFRDRDSGHVLENVVYFELLRRGYSVSVGKVGDKEIDFIASNAETKKYFQVTETMASEEVRKRELAPLQAIQDNYEKIILSLSPGLDSDYNGIRSLSLTDWLLEEEYVRYG